MVSGLIIHEWLAKYGGSEAVVDAFAEVADYRAVFCLWNDRSVSMHGDKIIESWLSRTPLRGRKAMSLPLTPAVWGNVKLESVDWLFVSSHSMAHQAAAHAMRLGIPRLVYVHTPARYLWAPELDERGQGLASRLIGPALRRLDRARTSDRIRYVANSRYIAKRIERSWHQESVVVHPPVDVQALRATRSWADHVGPEETLDLENLPQEYVLGASRFVAYKKLEDVVRVGEALGLPVVIAGAGPDENRLREQFAQARVPVRVVVSPSNQMLRALFQKASLYVFPPVEDFGIMPVESIALGTPVLVNTEGGASETIDATGGGASSSFQDPIELRRAAELAIRRDMVSAAERAAAFSKQAFQQKIAQECLNAGFAMSSSVQMS